ncbi:hypothetical protein Tco_0748397 [Tanacetum coccineum]|uniref:Uncharacterized protein n=1 Tax=Tanacetum coccineum TaxID=301880 RepID=A0ABQ4YY17_9ASTR
MEGIPPLLAAHLRETEWKRITLSPREALNLPESYDGLIEKVYSGLQAEETASEGNRSRLWIATRGKAFERETMGRLREEKTAIAELGMTPSTMHYAALYQSEEGPRVIMSEYQDIRRCEQVKRLKESLSEVPLEVSECVNLEEKIITNQKYPEPAITIGR